mgnify:CR=1 FL=1
MHVPRPVWCASAEFSTVVAMWGRKVSWVGVFACDWGHRVGGGLERPHTCRSGQVCCFRQVSVFTCMLTSSDAAWSLALDIWWSDVCCPPSLFAEPSSAGYVGHRVFWMGVSVCGWGQHVGGAWRVHRHVHSRCLL